MGHQKDRNMRNIVQKILTLVTTLGVAASANAQFSKTAQIGGNKIGSVTQNGPGSTTIVAGGNDIWDQQDEFTYNYQEIAGDFDVRVRVESSSPSARWAKSGIMARETLSDYSRHAMVAVNPPDVPTANGGNGFNGTFMYYRSGVQGAGLSGAQHEDIDAANTIPHPAYPNAWIRLVRSGSLLSASNSVDGVNWEYVSSQDTTTWLNGALPNSILVGLAASRHSGTPTATLEFRDLQINYGAGNPFAVGGASSRGNPNGIRVDFNGPAGAGALVAANYSVLGALVTGAAAGPTPNSVWLTTSALTEGTSYEVSVTGVSAVGGGALTTAGATFVHGAGYEARKIIVTHNHTDNNGYYRNSEAVRLGIGEAMVLGGDAFPGLQVNSLFEDPISDTGSHEQFSSRIAGVLNITASGNYTFAMSSDDVGFMYLSTNDDPANKVQIANEPA